MISAEDFCTELERQQFNFATGVPCSFFGGPIAHLERTPGAYVAAANEGNALATAVGAALAGSRSYVMLQNSGLGNLINPLTSLVMTYRVPVLTFVSLRGWPDPKTDEPQHEVMGPSTQPMIELLDLPHWYLRSNADLEEFSSTLELACEEMNHGNAPFILVEKGAVGKATASSSSSTGDGLPSDEIVRMVTEAAGGGPIVATTGYTGRELFGVDDRPSNFYMQGSMGHASSLALGIALRSPLQRITVLDGDGAALMHLGALSSIGSQSPSNLVHVVLDNGRHESTGGQPTTSSTTAIEDVATASGYRSALRCSSLQQAQDALRRAYSTPGPHMLVIPTLGRQGPMPPRATNKHNPEQMRDRFSAALS